MSNYRIYSGDKKSLVFPILGDGYVHLDYSRHIPKGTDGLEGNDDDAYGLWGHKRAFTIEAIATPYDVNGFGYRLGIEYGADSVDGTGTPAIHGHYSASNLGIPFLDKYYSPSGGSGTSTNSRTEAYFSQIKNCVLAMNIDNIVTTFRINNIENLIGGSILRIGREQMLITYIVKKRGQLSSVVVTRGQNGSTAESHIKGDIIQSDNRRNHKMTIFHNETCQFYLKNMTRGNMNQPAEYKLGCIMKGKDTNGNIKTVTVESNTPAISASKEYFSTPVVQPIGGQRVFGKPVYLNKNDRIRYHKIVDSVNHTLYYDRIYPSFTRISSGTVTFSSSANTINRTDTTWPASMTYILVQDSGNNDGYYKVTSGSGTDTITVDSSVWSNTNTGSLFTQETISSGTLGVTAMVVYYGVVNEDNILFSTGGSTLVDVENQMWMGKNLYSQFNDSRFFSASLQQTEPKYLGFITDITVDSSGNATDEVRLGVCKLIKPIRSFAETKLYVDDSSNVEIGDMLLIGGIEQVTVTSINGNTLTVTRATGEFLVTVKIVNTNATVTHDANANIIAGLSVSGIGIPTDTTIASITDSTHFELSAVATASGTNVTLTFLGEVTTSLNAFDLTGGSIGDEEYITDSREEDDFSRTISKNVIGKGEWFNGFKLVDGSNNSVVNSELYGFHVLTDTWMESDYVLRPFHLAMAYDDIGQRITLFLDGAELDASIFSETEFRIHSVITAGSATATVNTIGKHGLLSGDISNGIWISIKDTSVANLNGVWKVVSIVDDYNFTINVVNSLSSATHTDATVKDVTIRTVMTFDNFEFDATDCYLGSNGNEDLGTRRASQFMGELHEFCISKEYKETFQSIDTLLPNYRNTLLYFRFEEANL